jgi:hypothetical protein
MTVLVQKNEANFEHKLKLLFKVQEELTRKHLELQLENENLKNKLDGIELYSQKMNNKYDSNLILIYIICFFLISAITYKFMY